jgi:Zn-dependent M28 family amino/carboxypeptidase
LGWIGHTVCVRESARHHLLGLIVFIRMPSASYCGPLPSLSAGQSAVRDRLRAHVERLAGEIGERNLWHFTALQAAVAYIDNTFEAAGYRPVDEPFESRGKRVCNIIAEKPGTARREEMILVGAHYDSVHGSPGANDNGSGMGALLEVARLLADQALPRTVRFVAFVNEEPPFSYSAEMGSVVHAQGARARGEHIRAMLALETIGYYADTPGSQQYPFPLSAFYPDRANFIGFVGNLRSGRLVREALRTFRRHAAFPSEGAAVPGWITGVGWSDHWAFWQAGYPAIMVTDTAFFRYAHYHTADDTPDKVNYARTARVVTGLAGAIAELAGQPKGSHSP